MLQQTIRRASKAANLLNPLTLIRALDRIDQLARSTRELSKSIEQLRVQTEQLQTVQRLDWEWRDRTAGLDAQLDEPRIAAHVRRAIAAAPLHDDPCPHLVVEDWLPRDVYQTAIRALPPSIFFADRDESRQRLIVPFGVGPEYSRRVWEFMAHQVVSGMVAPSLTEKLQPLVHEYVRSFCPDMPQDVDLTLHASNGRIMLRRPGYVITPHRDPKWGFITCLVYLARRGDNETYGTQLYRVRNDEEAPSGNPFYVEESRCELVKSVPFRANTMLVFLNSRGAHGASIPADAQPPDLERYLYQFRMGPDNRAIGELLARMPEAQRTLWAGSKANRADGVSAYY